MSDVFALLAKPEGALVVRLGVAWRDKKIPEKMRIDVSHESPQHIDQYRFWDEIVLWRKKPVRTNINHDSPDIRKSAQLATEKIDRILRKEGDLWGHYYVGYTLKPVDPNDVLGDNIDGSSADLALALSFATKVCEVTHRQVFGPIAATGVVNEVGGIEKIGKLHDKLTAALKVLTAGSKIFGGALR